LRTLEKSNYFKNSFLDERLRLFISFTFPIFEKYKDTLESKYEIDFNDMINSAAELIEKNNETLNYKYIIIDEYQDISYSRFNLIKTIREKSNAKLICVGDDWQSIYRFTGSDLNLFSDFGKYVGPFEKLLIEKTYRNSQSLINITSEFIKKNTIQ